MKWVGYGTPLAPTVIFVYEEAERVRNELSNITVALEERKFAIRGLDNQNGINQILVDLISHHLTHFEAANFIFKYPEYAAKITIDDMQAFIQKFSTAIQKNIYANNFKNHIEQELVRRLLNAEIQPDSFRITVIKEALGASFTHIATLCQKLITLRFESFCRIYARLADLDPKLKKTDFFSKLPPGKETAVILKHVKNNPADIISFVWHLAELYYLNDKIDNPDLNNAISQWTKSLEPNSSSIWAKLTASGSEKVKPTSSLLRKKK